MKKHKCILPVLLAFFLFLCSPVFAGSRDYGKTTYDQTRWAEIKKDFLDTKTDRLIFVKYKGGTDAVVEMWKKVSVVKEKFFDLTEGNESVDPEEDKAVITKWKKIVSCNAYVGANGLGKKKQGDRKTPDGIFNIMMAFGREQSPGVSGIPYTKLNQYHYWSAEKDTYNQFVDVRALNRSQVNGEHLIDYNPQYNYALALDYNRECIYLKGAAIFLHCMGNKAYTLGCIAVPEKNMKKIIQNTTKYTKICIYPK